MHSAIHTVQYIYIAIYVHIYPCMYQHINIHSPTQSQNIYTYTHTIHTHNIHIHTLIFTNPDLRRTRSPCPRRSSTGPTVYDYYPHPPLQLPLRVLEVY